MMRNYHNFYTAFLISLLIVSMWSCANMGMPSGGPIDEDPPRVVSCSPPSGSVGVKDPKMTITFNELVNVKDAFSKVVVSPANVAIPRVSSLGRRVKIEFDSLAPNTTYTVDFADAIEDNNEANALQGYAYTFSTGESIDTLRISGRVLGARNLEPQQSMLVGVHSNLSDTAFSTLRLLRVAKTDDRGEFTIRGLAPGKYHIFALSDNDNDYRYSSPEEDMAFYDLEIEPTSEQTIAIDTIYDIKAGTIDTIIRRPRTRFLPNDILLRSFNSEIRQQYMTKYERLDSTRVFLKFNTRADSLPDIQVEGRPDITSIGRLEASERLDSLVWWLSPDLVKTDSLRLHVTYTRTDQNLVASVVTDTLDFNTVKPKPVKQKKSGKNKKVQVSVADSLAKITTKFELKQSGSADVNMPLTLTIPTPLARLDTTAARLYVKVDTNYVRAPQRLRFFSPDPLQPRTYNIDYPWDYGAEYRLEIDTLAGVDIYGKATRPFKQDFKTKSEGDYCSLLFHLTGLDGTPSFVELLSKSDAVVRTEIVENGDAYFPFLTPGQYYARVVLDFNDNGEYDTGNYLLGLQPELAYYYPKAINVKKNWDKEENWAVFDMAVDQMKPKALLKNKPKENKNASRLKNKNKKGESGEEGEEDEEEIFDPTRNPFDPNDKGNRQHGIRY